jgi:hypothetical protein
MKRNLWPIAALLVGVMLLSAVGCGTEDAESLTIQEIVAGTTAAENDLKTFAYVTTSDIPFCASMTGMVDLENKIATLEQEVTFMGQSVTKDWCFVGEESYCYDDDSGWEETEYVGEGSYWDMWDPLGQQLSLLEHAADTEPGSGKVNGMDCYVVDVTPSPDTVETAIGWDWVPSEGDEEVSILLWIAKDTLFPVKTSFTLYGTVEGETRTLSHQTVYSDHNETLNMEVPPELLPAG